MENTRNGSNKELNDNLNWNKEASEELVLIYLEDYYRTMDDYFLQEAFQIAKDECSVAGFRALSGSRRCRWQAVAMAGHPDAGREYRGGRPVALHANPRRGRPCAGPVRLQPGRR